MRTHEGLLYCASEDLSGKIGMKQGFVDRRSLDENLAPLKRWIESQANRPWNNAYAQLCASIDRRNSVQEHIFAHIDNFVACETNLIDGKVHVVSAWERKPQPVEESRATLHVHPLTGMRPKNRHRIRRKQHRQEEQRSARDALAAKRCDLSPWNQFHCPDHIWYHVTLAMLDEPVWRDGHNRKQGLWVYRQHWDAIRNRMVSRHHRRELVEESAYGLFGKPDVYAAAKRQLSSAELK